MAVARKFFEVAFAQMEKRLPNCDSLLMKADCITLKSNEDIHTLREIATNFTNIIAPEELTDIYNELVRLNLQRTDLCHKIVQMKNPLLVWKQHSTDFPLVYKLVRALSILPYSTSAIELNFSWINNTKTAQRNRLNVNHLEAILLLKQEINRDTKYKPTLMMRFYQIIRRD